MQELISQFIFAQAASTKCDPNNIGVRLCNPLANLGSVTDVTSFIKYLLNDLGGVIGLVAITMLVYAGFRMVTANGDKGVIDKAKQILKYSIYGFVISILAYSGVVAVENFIQVRDVNYDSSQIINPLSQQNLRQFVEQMIRNVLMILGIVSVFMIVLNGFRYMTARGNQSQVDDAKRALTWAIAGLAISLFAYTIVSVVANLIS